MSFSTLLGPASVGALSSVSADLVHGDLVALAAHMQHCARSRGPMFGLRSALQAGQSAAASRIVTVACIGFGLVIAVLALA
ncbi:hypothetical protein [Variovorax sp. dw_954]|uniref:hypothetical protein n=1 Tax=Variovorax sp. dw_954 TaxID=2720078 RepID=UPI002115D42F|nr:hypothetical protein [Variovorax sp. dw_954]